MNSSQTDLGEFSHFSTSPTGIPNQTLLDYHHPHITGKLGTPLETLHQAACQNTTNFHRSLDQHPSPTQLLFTLQLELSNIQDIYNSGESTITSAIQLLNPTNHRHIHIAEKVYYLFLETPSVGSQEQPPQKDIHSIKNMDKPTYCHTDITTQHLCPYCVNLEHHKVHHTG